MNLAFCAFKRRDAVGYHAPFVLGDAGGFLKQRDAVRGQVRPLDLKAVIEPVKRGREPVAEHAQEVASPSSFLTDRSSWRGSKCRARGSLAMRNRRDRRTVADGDEQAAGSAIWAIRRISRYSGQASCQLCRASDDRIEVAPGAIAETCDEAVCLHWCDGLRHRARESISLSP